MDLLALRSGEDQALNRIMQRWERPLFAFAYRYLQSQADAEDIAVEVFARLYENRERLRADTRLSAWLFTTAANLCRNQLRWRRRHPSISFDEAPREDGLAPSETVADAERTPEAVALDHEALEAVQHCLEELPHEMKVAVLLHYFEQLSYREIGAVLGCSERGVETRLYRARQYMRPSLERYFGAATPH